VKTTSPACLQMKIPELEQRDANPQIERRPRELVVLFGWASRR